MPLGDTKHDRSASGVCVRMRGGVGLLGMFFGGGAFFVRRHRIRLTCQNSHFLHKTLMPLLAMLTMIIIMIIIQQGKEQDNVSVQTSKRLMTLGKRGNGETEKSAQRVETM